VFLEAARLIGVPPASCLAFEDAPIGVVAAAAAGLPCVAVTTSFTSEGFTAHGAAPVAAIADFEEYLSGPGRWLESG
jgi:beta-phosphoglucomutase-like phosphatase (HAD superfamily)